MRIHRTLSAACVLAAASLTSTAYALPDGDLAPVDQPDGLVKVSDALVALRYALGLVTPITADVLAHGDVAPLVNGAPSPDGRINIADALVLLRVALGLSSLDGAVSTPTSTGYFKDANTAGLEYTVGGYHGVTGADGSYMFTPNTPISFSVGGVTLGAVEARELLSPLEMIEQASTDTRSVQNMVRFLLMLDEDGDPTNGIVIPLSVRVAAENWPEVDFNAEDLAAELAPIIADIAAHTGTVPTLPPVATAQSHFEGTLACMYAGAYAGTYSGGDRGNWGLLVDAKTNMVTGVAYSTLYHQYFPILAQVPVSFDYRHEFVSGTVVTGATYTGSFTTPDNVQGSWTNPYLNISGSLSGGRVGGAVTARYRFTGLFNGYDYGLFSFDIDDQNQIAGVAYSVSGDTAYDISGSVNGTTLSAHTTDGTAITSSIDVANGTITNGSWNNPYYGISGEFTGNGCTLN